MASSDAKSKALVASKHHHNHNYKMKKHDKIIIATTHSVTHSLTRQHFFHTIQNNYFRLVEENPRKGQPLLLTQREYFAPVHRLPQAPPLVPIAHLGGQRAQTNPSQQLQEELVREVITH